MPGILDSFRAWKKQHPGGALIAAFVLVFVLGYGIGREHMKVQIRNSIQDVFSGIGGNDPEPEKKRRTFFQKTAPVEMTLQKKEGVEYANPYMQGFESIGFSIEFANTSDKAIRAFDGSVLFEDLFEKPILTMGITYEDGLAAGEKKVWKGFLDYNEFIDGHQRLVGIDQEDLQSILTVDSIIYEDGTKEEF